MPFVFNHGSGHTITTKEEVLAMNAAGDDEHLPLPTINFDKQKSSYAGAGGSSAMREQGDSGNLPLPSLVFNVPTHDKAKDQGDTGRAGQPVTDHLSQPSLQF